MKKLFSLMVMFGLIFILSSQAFAVTTNSFWVAVEDEQGKPVTTATVTVYTVNTLTLPTIYSDYDGATAQTVPISVDTTSGIASWYGTASTYDIIVDNGTGQQSKISDLSTGMHTVVIPSNQENRRTTTFSLSGSNAATAANYIPCYIAEEDGEIVSVRVRTEGTGATASVILKKAVSGQALSNGSGMLQGYIALSTAGIENTVKTGTLSSTYANTQYATSDAVGFVASGSLTGLSGFAGTVEYKKR